MVHAPQSPHRVASRAIPPPFPVVHGPSLLFQTKSPDPFIHGASTLIDKKRLRQITSSHKKNRENVNFRGFLACAVMYCNV